MRATVTSTALLEGLRNEDDAVWSDYVGRFRPIIVQYARRLGLRGSEAEDLAQEALLAFASSYRAGKYDRSRGRLRAWLFGIASTLVKSWHRSERRRGRMLQAETGGGDLVAQLPDDASMEDVWDEEWRREMLTVALAEVQREVHTKTFEAFDRFARRQQPASDVARRLGISENAVFCAKQRVLRRLRELLAAMEDAG